MPVDDFTLPGRLLAGGGPGSPDPRVLQALATPLVGQFDPAFTAIMDDVMELGRQAFLTHNRRCFPVSGLAAAGLEALLATLIQDGDLVAIGGGPGFVAETADMASRYGARPVSLDAQQPAASVWVVPLIDDRQSAGRVSIPEVAAAAHAQGALLIVEASLGLGGCELRVDEWGVDGCVAGVEFAIGSPPGLALVTYSASVEERMLARRSPPRTSYLDLVQLQAYWSPERLNHHTAPTSLVYGLREALRLVHAEGLGRRWERHRRVGQALRVGLEALGLEVGGESPYAIVRWPAAQPEASARRTLLEQFGVHVRLVSAHTWCIGLLGADARLEAALRVLTAIEQVLRPTGAVAAAVEAYA